MEVTVEGRTLALSNLGKVLYPADGFTKAEVIDYYAKIAPAILPHLGDRAVTLRRFPNGPSGTSFYEKNCPKHRPEWLRTAPVQGEDGLIDFCRIDSVAALTWVANLAALELHTPMARAEDPDAPTMVVFDLDPGPPAGLVECAEVALLIRHVLDDLGLDCLVKTSGSKGMQLYLPLNTPTTHGRTAGFSRTVAQALESSDPKRVISVQTKRLRKGKVLVDWSQNSRHKTTVCVYSLRAQDQPTVSAPITWAEIEEVVAERDPSTLRFTAPDVLDRVERLGDLFAPAAALRQELPDLAFDDAKSTRIIRD
ncbi:MAG: ATP-dependent DNA ligase [Acidimicrobiia bacterium]|nr:ATP-dependent DNA ligase [Acidimicrobiia bacterium]